MIRTRFAAAAAPLAGFALAVLGGPVAAQSIENPARLTGIGRVDVRAEAVWDEAIMVEAGGATPDQFLQALRTSFRDAIESADDAPTVTDGSSTTVACHVDTFYETGQIVYSLRVQVEAPGPDGEPVITWIKSWVGNYTVQQLHLMFGLGTQCAQSFLDDWRSAN